MTTIFILAAIGIYLLFYFTYGRFLSRKVVKTDPDNIVPSEKLKDGIDYVPTKRFVLFGHHFASIAGAAPIVGPAMAMSYGWLPGFLWVWFGNIFIGAVHDFFSLSASVRYDGKSIQFVSQKLLGKFSGSSFAWFILFLCILVVAAFGAIVGGLFVNVPAAASSFLFMIAAAILLGVLLYRSKLPFWLSTLIGIGMLVGTIFLGQALPIKLSYTSWMVVFFFYIIIAASIPVTLLLQPRDYLNSFLLYFGLFVGGAAAILSAKTFSAPAFTSFSPVIFGNAKTPFWPAIPLIIACGSLSGFHSLVSSGTSSKQLASEKDSLFIGYGAMFTEGILSTLAIISIAAFGITAVGNINPALAETLKGSVGWGKNYSGVLKSPGIKNAAGMFVQSFATMTSSVLPIAFNTMKIITTMWIASFAMTTLDTTNRLARYIVSELAEPVQKFSKKTHALLTNRWFASLIPAALGIGLAWSGGWKMLWPAFSAANQLIASVTMITVSAWIYKKLQKKHLGITLIPGFVLWVTVNAGIIWYMTSIIPAMVNATPTKGYIVAFIMGLMFLINLILLVSFFKNFRNSSQA